MTQVYRLGWKRDLPDPCDLHYTFIKPAADLPKSVDLRTHMPFVYDQGNLGSCTAQAIAGAIEYHEIRQQKVKPQTPSRLMIYYLERYLEGTVRYDVGAYIRDGMKVVNKWGYCEEFYWPYVVSKFARKPSQAAYEDAADCKISAYARVT